MRFFAFLAGIVLFVPLATAAPLTGDRLAASDADGDGFADAAESGAGSDPRSGGSTPLRSAGDAATGGASVVGASSREFLRAGWAASNASAADTALDAPLALLMVKSSETFVLAVDRATTVRVLAESGTRSTSVFLASKEVASGTVDDEDGSGVPVQGAYVDRNGDGARAVDGSEEVAITDRDRDLYGDSIERALGTDPSDRASSPSDLDGDGFSNVAEVRAGSDPTRAGSTPYTDDDGDGEPNGSDALPLVNTRR